MCTGIEIAALASVLIGAGTSAYSAYSSSQQKAPKLQPPPLPVREETSKKADKNTLARRARAARSSTILTEPGLGDTNTNVLRPTLGA